MIEKLKHMGIIGGKWLKTILPLFLLMFALLLSHSAKADEISSLRIGQGVGTVRIVLDSDSKFEYKAFLLGTPSRLVIDTYGIDINPDIEHQITKNNLIKSGRIGTIESDGRRIVFDLAKPAVIKKAFMLAPQSNFGWRFVLDVELVSQREFN